VLTAGYRGLLRSRFTVALQLLPTRGVRVVNRSQLVQPACTRVIPGKNGRSTTDGSPHYCEKRAMRFLPSKSSTPSNTTYRTWPT